MKAALLASLSLVLLAGCVESTGRGGYYDDEYDSGRGYYSPRYQQRHGGTYNNSDQDAYERRRRRIEVNCNMQWQNCSAVCNQIADAAQRYVCVANCNNALNQCKNQR